MRRRIVLIGLACLVTCAISSRPAAATDCSGILSTCINDDTLWPHAGASGFESIGSTRTLAAQQLGFGLVTTYLSRPIVLQLRSPGGGSDQYAVNDEVNGTFVWAYGVTSRLELDLALPVTFGQGGAGLAPVTGSGGLRDTAVRDIRFGFAYALLPLAAPSSGNDGLPPDGFSASARFEVSAPTGDPDQFAGEHGAVFVPSVSGDFRSGHFFAGAELGARIRPVAELLGARVGSQIVTALGAGVDLLPRELLSLRIEAWALPTLVGQETVIRQADAYAIQSNSTVLAPAEWQASARTAPLPGGDVSIELGGGGPLPLSGETPVTTPRFRFVLGVRWAPTGRPKAPSGAPVER
jgi:hypothetical protein